MNNNSEKTQTLINNVLILGVFAGNDSNMFSMKIHHGGMFTDPPGRMYVNGTESFIDNVDTDLFSVIELNDMIMMIGYRGNKKMYYQYMVPDSDLDNGLRALGSDQDVHDLSSYVLYGHKLINVYTLQEKRVFGRVKNCTKHSKCRAKCYLARLWHGFGSVLNMRVPNTFGSG